MMTLLTLSNPAYAYVLPCTGPYVGDTVPFAGATDVPVDVAPAIVWVDSCEDGGSLEIVLMQGDSLIAELSVDIDAGQSSGVGRLLPGQLEPNTEYRLVYTHRWGDELESLFTTGEGLVQGAGGPEVLGFSARAWRQDGGFDLQCTLEAALGEDPDGLSVLVVSNEDGDVRAGLVDDRDGEGGSVEWFYDRVEERPEEYCVFVVQEDGAGVAGDAVEACTEPERGCSTAPLGASLFVGLLAMLLARREEGSPS